ncbi:MULTISPECIES: co-chaperone YbbN [unclassified Nocardia]|uniref:thioredoxin family protein n=1 Tax=unclassified Nocardia TaxID=2637762 RepID=UPI00278C48A2|nr:MULTISPECIES: thioredoxin family protein [unclassified Nocardia]
MRRIRFPELGLPGRVEYLRVDEQSGELLDRREISARGTVEVPDDAMLTYAADHCPPADLARVSRDAFATMMLTGVDDELLGVVGTMANVQHLELCGDFTDTGTRALAWTADMFVLELDSPHIGPDLHLPGGTICLIAMRGDRLDDRVFDLVAARQPFSVEVAGAAITGAGLGALAAVPELEEVRLSGRNLRAAHLTALAATAVTALSIEPDRIDPKWADAILGLPGLRTVEVGQLDPAPLSSDAVARLLAAGLEVNGIRAGAAELAATAAELAVGDDHPDDAEPDRTMRAALRPVDDEAEFDALLAGDAPVLVQLTATWCGPCKQLRPVLEGVLSGFEGRITGVVVDIDRAPWAERFDFRSVPAVLAFAGGREMVRFVGVRSAADITALLTATVGLDRV